MLVLVGEVDQGYSELIGELLRRQSHRAVLANSSDSFDHYVQRSTANLIIVSADFGGASAAEMVRDLLQRHDTPVIVLFDSASPAEVASCLAAGADDCIRKPFHPTEFAARIEAVLRRSRPVPTLASEHETSEDVAPTALATKDGLRLDPVRKRAEFNGEDLGCSELEYNILDLLAGMEGQVLSHSFLNARVWGYPNLTDGTLLKGHVSALRQKLMRAGSDRSLIRTIYGVGYALSA